MPKREDIKSVLLIGSGPIVIGQACEFDYSGTQAVKALREEGLRVILVNSNPATIMTDPSIADRTYVEPITTEFLERIIDIERPDAILPTMGGQTALNAAISLEEAGVLEKYGCQLIGANIEAIKTAEDREAFRTAMAEIGIESARSLLVRKLGDVDRAVEEIGFPIILRPSRTLGGTGGGIANSKSELKRMVSYALSMSPNSEVLLEESLLGWKELELEVMRDLKDNVVIICGIENIDPMGVHTGDSITVAPIQTLTDKEYQIIRDYSRAVMRRIGVDTGGSNVQFAINPENGRVVIIEMNPRVSRSSALASKATGFPIAKIAAKLALGYTLDEIPNDITQETPASFEPSIDYTVIKIPRFNFEKFPLADNELGTQMKSVGEVMSIGRTFREAMLKALLSREQDSIAFDFEKRLAALGDKEVLELSAKPSDERLNVVAEALRRGCSIEQVHEVTKIDRWFLVHIEQIVQQEEQLRAQPELSAESLLELKRAGFSDERIDMLRSAEAGSTAALRKELSVAPSFPAVDTCAAEFRASTPYYYSSYDNLSSVTGKLESDSEASIAPGSIIILGSGPNRIGQGIEFDYCCVHAVMALQELGHKVVMVNCNPETVSTDYDVSDRLYFEPLSFEHVVEICRREKPKGVIVQFGGQTPLKIAADLEREGIPILGTSVAAIEKAEDRKLFAEVIDQLGLQQAPGATAGSAEEAFELAEEIGFPLMIRPSFVLGGRAMRIVYSTDELREYIAAGVDVSNQRPVLLDRFLENAIEVDVDALHDGEQTRIAGIMEHIERAGIHSGDSSCSIPPATLSELAQKKLAAQASQLAEALEVRGLLNVQFAVTEGDEVYIIEANPRASRTIPFVSKATSIPWAKMAAKVMSGEKIAELGIPEKVRPELFSVKACVFPFDRFKGVDTILGPEMKSTGEVMGIGKTFGEAFYKSQLSAQNNFPTSGRAFLSVRDEDKCGLPAIAENLRSAGFELVATTGTRESLAKAGIEVQEVRKVQQGSPHVVDMLGAGEIDLVINTPEGSGTFLDSASIRLVATEMRIPVYTTIAAASAASEAILNRKDETQAQVFCLQDFKERTQ